MRTEVVMECQHVAVFSIAPPRTGQRIYCTRCKDMRRVVGGPDDWRAICDNCTSLYLTRRSPDSIRNGVIKHLMECPEHAVTVWQVGHDASAVKVRLDARAHLLDGWDSTDTLRFGA